MSNIQIQFVNGFLGGMETLEAVAVKDVHPTLVRKAIQDHLNKDFTYVGEVSQINWSGDPHHDTYAFVFGVHPSCGSKPYFLSGMVFAGAGRAGF